jgi:thioredoxin 1
MQKNYAKYKDLPTSEIEKTIQQTPPQIPSQMQPQKQIFQNNPHLNNNNITINNNQNLQNMQNFNSQGIISVENLEHKINLIKQNIICVVDVYADWCGPCKGIASRYEEISIKYSRPGVCAIVKENIDRNIKEPSLFPEVKGVPFFQFFKNGIFVASIVGADIQSVENKIVELLQSLN